MELLIKLAERVKFTYDLHLVGDGQFGSLKKVQFTGSDKITSESICENVLSKISIFRLVKQTFANFENKYEEEKFLKLNNGWS